MMTLTPSIATARRAFSSNRSLLIGSIGLLLILAMGLLGKLVWPVDPLELTPDKFIPPSAAHPMGTDDLGRDVLARVILGSQVSLMVGVAAAVIATAVGCAFGAVAGYLGGWADEILMRIAEVFQI